VCGDNTLTGRETTGSDGTDNLNNQHFDRDFDGDFDRDFDGDNNPDDPGFDSLDRSSPCCHTRPASVREGGSK